MLSADDLTLAIDIQSRCYRLLRWVADAIKEGFIPATRAHEYANVADSTFDWLELHYANFPADCRPDRRHLRQFANFFSTYVMTLFDVVENPDVQLVSRCGCYCCWCSQIVKAPHLRPKKLSKRDKARAADLMVDRVVALALEERVPLAHDDAVKITEDEATRRSAAYSAYGYWLIKRMDGTTDGKSVLALWREIAWHPAGSPIKNFSLQYRDFIAAEESLVGAMRALLLERDNCG